MTSSFWVISILLFDLAPSQNDIIRFNKTRIICDGSTTDSSCINATFTCAPGLNCEIICDIPDITLHDASISPQNSDCASETYGCCHTHIHCPPNQTCDIFCSGGGCLHTYINATSASHLDIHGCNEIHNNHLLSSSSCYNMSIFCPFAHGSSCRFEGNYIIEHAHIHTLRGFNDIYIQPMLTLNSSVLYCGPTAKEYNCTTNNYGTKCIHNDIIICGSNNIKERNFNKDISVYFDINTKNKTQIITYIAVAVWLLIPLLISIIALIYHQTQTGSDPPAYLSVFKSFINIADFYTDIIFCVFLLKQNSILYIPAIICTALPHIISIILCMIYIHKWSNNIYKIAYIKRHDTLLIALTVLIGFMPTIQILSCKLFYASYLTLPTCFADRVRMQQFKFINHNLLEDIPLVIMQLTIAFNLYTISTESYMASVLWMTFIFSSLSIIVGTISFVLKCGHYPYQQNIPKLKTYELDITSNEIESRHYYCHRLLSQCLCYALKTNNGRIETVSVVPIVDGISCRVEIKYKELDEIHDIDDMFKYMTDNQSDIFHAFHTVLRKKLHMRQCMDLNVLISKLDVDGLEGNITKLKGRNTLYVPLTRRSIDATNSLDPKKGMNRLSASRTGDVIEEDDGMPLKQKSLLFESMKKARVNTIDNLTNSIKGESIEMTVMKPKKEVLNETQINTQNAIKNGCITKETQNVKNSDNVAQENPLTNYQSELLSHCES